MRVRLAIDAAVVLFSLAAAARADSAVAVRAEEIVVEDEAAPAESPLVDAPVEIERIDAEHIERSPASHAADVVGNLPGIRTQRRLQGEEAAVSIEGLPPEYTRVLVDGERDTGEIGGVSDLRDISIENARRIEILRGAQALRYGSEAAGGVVNLITEEPPAEGWRFRLDAGGGADHKIRAAGTLAGRAGRVGATLSFDHDQIDGYDPPDDTDDAVFVPSGSGSRRLSRDARGAIVVEGPAGILLRTRGGFRREDESFIADEEAGASGRRETRRIRASQHLAWQVGDATRLLGTASLYQRSTESNVGRPFELDEREIGAELALERFLETGPFAHLLTLSLDLDLPRIDLREESASSSEPGGSLGSADIRARTRSLGVTLVAASELGDWASLEWGARLQLHSLFDRQISPQAALLLRPWRGREGRGLRVRLSYGRSHRLPSLRELVQPPVAQLGGAYFLAGNPELQPESATSYRASIELVPHPSLSLSAVGFWNEMEDHIRSTFAGSLRVGTQRIEVPTPPAKPGLDLICEVTGDFFPECAALGGATGFIEVPITSPVFRKTNLDAVRTRGIEARLRFRPHRLVDLRLAYTFLDTSVSDSNVDLEELPNEARHVVDGQISLEVPRLRTILALRGRWRGRALIETSGTGLLSFGTTTRSKPSLVLDARISQPLGRRLELYADLRNLGDERVVDSYIIRGRTFFVGLRAHLGPAAPRRSP